MSYKFGVTFILPFGWGKKFTDETTTPGTNIDPYVKGHYQIKKCGPGLFYCCFAIILSEGSNFLCD